MPDLTVQTDEWNFRVEICNPAKGTGTDGWWWYVYDANTGKELVFHCEPMFGPRMCRFLARRWIRKFVKRGGGPFCQIWHVHLERNDA